MFIRELTLYTTQLRVIEQFYVKTLGFSLLNSSPEEITIKAGSTKLKFRLSHKSTPYHFAFNIPAYQEEEALSWLKAKVDIIEDEGNEIQGFDKWNAKAIYFYDPDMNIGEFISRRAIAAADSNSFSIESILAVSEIGIAVEKTPELCRDLINNHNIPIYDGDQNRFTALGDEHGLFICINKLIKNWYPTEDAAFSSPFEISLSAGDDLLSGKFDGQALKLVKE